MDALKIKVIIGTTREGRFSEKPANWIMERLKGKEGVEAELLDLRDYPLPFFEESDSPNYKKAPYSNPTVVAWTAKIAEADGFIVVTGEYNHGYPAVLKNAFDYVSANEWGNKPIAFVSYGSALGNRAIVALRVVAIELGLAPVRFSVNIPSDIYAAAGKLDAAASVDAFKPLDERADGVINLITSWGRALKEVREKKA
ncbi:MAG: NAD(P)H-dependent oxidoreductase [Candidatus Kaiserbacteria bacterium]|nr:NAD(P)H-dependent oxidoreductase [Candidatus Kaiserbacteria bacterium]